ncbi:MAG: carbohydrate-binding protein [Flavisolibacter sp.]
MRNFTRRVLLLTVLFAAVLLQKANAQSILDPTDVVVTYDSTHPPTQPVWGQIGKWVRTRRPEVTWNTDGYKAYIYKGVAFRLYFPKTYNPTLNDGKKYPMMIFFHGHGEAAPIYDNEWHLLHGCQLFASNVDNGNFDGYILAPQTSSYFSTVDYAKFVEIIEYMIANNKLDPFQITVNGLSQGGQACWDILYNYPTYISTSVPMSWSQNSYTDPSFINVVKQTPIWDFQGDLDTNPAPYTTYQVRDALLAAGANFKLTEYPNADHGTWWSAWAEPDFWDVIKRGYSSNPSALYGKTSFFPGDTISSTLGLAPGFSAYEWRKDGVLISGATTNTLHATALGKYDARVQRNGIWSDWSRVPLQLKMKTVTTLPAHIEAENWSAMSSVVNEWTPDGGGGLDVGYINYLDWMDYDVYAPAAGNYTFTLRVSSAVDGAKFQIRKADGTALATITVPNTGGWQTYQNLQVTVSLPAGYQTLRLISTATPSWNINWFEVATGGATSTNKAPVVNAGPDQSVTLPSNSVTLSGSANDSDGTIASYKWTVVSGPAGSSFGTPTAASTTVTGLVQGSYTFRLTATDNGGATGSDDVMVTVAPQASTGTTRIEAENWSAMTGVATESAWGDPQGGGLIVGWIDQGDWMDYVYNAPAAGVYTVNFRIATPLNGAQFQMRNASGAVLTTVSVPNTGAWQTWQTISTTVNLPAGAQTIRLYASTTAGWNINWFELSQGGVPPGNQPPTVNAGADQTITLPANSANLSGSATDVDGTIASYQWTVVSGPAGSSFGTPAAASTTVSGLVQGTYTFRLTAKDNSGAAATDDVVVTVAPAATATTRIQAENWSAMSGVSTESAWGDPQGGGLIVGWIDQGDWMDYVFNAPVAGVYTVNWRLATPLNGAQFQMRNASGTVLSTISVPNTGAWQTWTTISTTVSLPAGTQTIRLYASTTAGWNINWFELTQPGGSTGAMAPRAASLQAAETSTALGVYPNPVRDQFTLSLNNTFTGLMKIQVIGMNGAVQKEFSLNKTSGRYQSNLSIGNLPKGVYTLSIQMNGWKDQKSIIKL